jgi:hypothetical protein
MTSSLENRKRLGQVLTPETVARALVSWVIRQENERLLDPSCGDGRFVACHRASVGVEIHRDVATVARTRAPWALIHQTEFFAWASETRERFEAAAGNPPFIRYQHFNGIIRERALTGAAKLGARFNGLASSWAPFLVVTAALLKPGGRMAFVVPAEIGHAPYAVPMLTALCDHFDELQVIAIQKSFSPISQKMHGCSSQAASAAAPTLLSFQSSSGSSRLASHPSVQCACHSASGAKRVVDFGNSCFLPTPFRSIRN